MAGLVAAEAVFPYGYNGPTRYIAKHNNISSISPGLYDARLLQTSYRAHVPVPKLGNHWPKPNEGDSWGNVNSKINIFPSPEPDAYDIGRLELQNEDKVPVPLPRAHHSLVAQLVGASEVAQPSANAPGAPPTDILEIGKMILKTTVDPRKRFAWESYINTLTKLRMIANERPSGLNGEEMKLEKSVTAAMKAEAMSITNPAPAYVAPSAPLSAADVETAMINALATLRSSRSSKPKKVDDSDVDSEADEVKGPDAPPEILAIGAPTDGRTVAIVTISNSAVVEEFKRQFNVLYPAGLTTDVALWRSIISLFIPKENRKKELRSFEPKHIAADPKRAATEVYLKMFTKRAAVALQYIAENGLATYIKDKTLETLFQESAKNPPRFLNNPAYIANIIP